MIALNQLVMQYAPNLLYHMTVPMHHHYEILYILLHLHQLVEKYYWFGKDASETMQCNGTCA